MPHKLSAISTAFYGNYACVDANNQILFRCDEKKKEWYLKRNLAEMISDNPPTFRLLFVPKGKGHNGDPFFLQDRKNECVVCGSEDDLTRHHVVPHCYRRFYPKEYNRFGSYDVMMLCEPDHIAYEYYSRQFRLKLAEEFDAPIEGMTLQLNNNELIDTKILTRAVSSAFALLKHNKKIPLERQKLLFTDIKDYLKKDEITQEDLEKLCEKKTKKKNLTIKTQGEIILSKLTDINIFNVRWRRHFMDVMNPKFLPDYWQIERVFDLKAD